MNEFHGLFQDFTSHQKNPITDFDDAPCTYDADDNLFEVDGPFDLLGNSNVMNTADWRWAAEKGFWDPRRRCWNEELGGIKAYLAQRNKRRAVRAARLRRDGQDKAARPKVPKSKSASLPIQPAFRVPEGFGVHVNRSETLHHDTLIRANTVPNEDNVLRLGDEGHVNS